MTHLEPEELEPHLIDQQAKDTEGDSTPLRYFIPYLLLNRLSKPEKEGPDFDSYLISRKSRPVTENEQANDEIRRALRRYVFIQAPKAELDKMLQEYWNKGRVRLNYYKDIDGIDAIIPDVLMHQFIQACIQRRERFSLSPHVRSIEKGATVTIRRGAFKDLQAEVFQVTHTSSGIRLTLSIEFFAGTQDIRLYDKTLEDIELANDDNFVISNDFLAHVEELLLTILERKVSRYAGLDADKARLEDMRKLNLLSIYHTFETTDPQLSTRYDALMLICATLRQDPESRSHYNKLCKHHLKSLLPSLPSSPSPAPALSSPSLAPTGRAGEGPCSTLYTLHSTLGFAAYPSDNESEELESCSTLPNSKLQNCSTLYTLHSTLDDSVIIPTALFISTKDPKYRQQAKQLARLLPSDPILSRYIKCICTMK